MYRNLRWSFKIIEMTKDTYLFHYGRTLRSLSVSYIFYLSFPQTVTSLSVPVPLNATRVRNYYEKKFSLSKHIQTFWTKLYRWFLTGKFFHEKKLLPFSWVYIFTG